MTHALTVKLAGIAGQGVVSAGKILGKALINSGYNVLVHDNFSAEIRGNGKSVTTIRFSNESLFSMGDFTDVVCLLDLKSPMHELRFLRKKSVILIPDRLKTKMENDFTDEWKRLQTHTLLFVPINEFLTKHTGLRKTMNLVLVGILTAIIGLQSILLEKLIAEKFKNKQEKVLNNALVAFRFGYEKGLHQSGQFIRMPQPALPKGRLINGNSAVVEGALRSNLKFFAGYPITPATPIMEALIAKLPDYGGWGMQMEDEIASISAVVGASFAGSPAMTATSGPGFALMGEMLNLAVMAEIPLVVINVQRGGPATGMPTKSEQADLNMAIYGGAGDAPRVVLAPSTIEDSFKATQLAISLAEMFQTPVIVLLDLYLGYLTGNVDQKVFERKTKTKRFEPKKTTGNEFLRFRLTADGVSPMPVPGKHESYYTLTGLEHNELGRPNYDGDIHFAMTAKRFRKFETMLKELPEPDIKGPLDAGIGIIAWGSTWGPAYEAAKQLNREGIKTKILNPMVIAPLQKEIILKFCHNTTQIYVPEVNYQGQFASYLKSQLNLELNSILLPSEKLIRPQLIVHAIQENLYVHSK